MNYLVIGDQCTDIFIYGEVNRLSPEAPIPIFIPKKKIENSGMAKNVYSNLFSLITPHKYCSVIGHFPHNKTTKTRYVEDKSNHYFIRIDENDETERIQINKYLKKAIEISDCIIISDYNKGFLLEDDILEICQWKNEKSIVFLDTKKLINDNILEHIDFIKFNESEFNKNKNNISLDKYEDKIIITKGSDGAVYKNEKFDTEKKLTMDVSGAGDTFLAALAYNFMNSKNIKIAIQKANQAAAEVVTKRGVSVI